MIYWAFLVVVAVIFGILHAAQGQWHEAWIDGGFALCYFYFFMAEARERYSE